ncbi:MAG: hypothetical protein GY938_03000 [Ketobacter sp.]|nr:hypothetical protein [Ketobacter sp.]
MKFCKHYTNMFDIRCAECDQGYVKSMNGLQCLESSMAKPKCDTMNDTNTTCIICENGFWEVQGECKQKDIANCLYYLPHATSLTCLACELGYYVLNNECVSGTIDNC